MAVKLQATGGPLLLLLKVSGGSSTSASTSISISVSVQDARSDRGMYIYVGAARLECGSQQLPAIAIEVEYTLNRKMHTHQ